MSKSKQSYGQNYADKKHYLVDSLDLDVLTESDKEIIATSLKNYHEANTDTGKIAALSSICENMMHADWGKYQLFQYELLEKALKNTTNSTHKKELKELQSSALNNLGIISHNMGNTAEAIDYWHKSLAIAEEMNNQEGIAALSNSIGTVYHRQGYIETATEYYLKNIQIKEDLNDFKGLSIGYNNLGLMYQEEDDYDQAIIYFNKGLNAAKEINYEKGLAYNYSSIGLVFNHEKKYDEAFEAFFKTLEIVEKIGLNEMLSNVYYNLGRIRFEQGKTSKAYPYALKNFKVSKDLGYPDNIKVAAQLLGQIYEEQGKGLKALEMFRLSIQMRDSLTNEATQKATAQQQAKYEYEKRKTIDDAEHEKQLAIEQESKAKQKVITIAIGAGLVLVIVFLAFIFNRLQVTRKQKVVIEQQRDEVEEAHKEIRDSINYAERIQRSFLAADELLNDNLNDYFVFFKPKDVVSGDFYWAAKLSNDNFALVNADSTGHGVPGSIMSILNISSIEKAIEKGLTQPAEIFNYTRNAIIERLKKDGSEKGGKDGMDASIISFDFKNNKFSFAAAQNPIWIIRKSELIEIKPEKMPLGKHVNDNIPFVGGEFETQKGDVVYSLTDGFQDQFGGENGKKFKVRPFKDLIVSISHLPMQEQKEKLEQTFANWKGNEEQVDDVCIIGVRI